jgi:hypothetical protein
VADAPYKVAGGHVLVRDALLPATAEQHRLCGSLAAPQHELLVELPAVCLRPRRQTVPGGVGTPPLTALLQPARQLERALLLHGAQLAPLAVLPPQLLLLLLRTSSDNMLPYT